MSSRMGFVAILSWVCGVGLADVRLSAVMGSHMVLQRDSKVVIWGFANPGESVRVDFHGQKVATRTAQNGRWSVSLGPFPAGGPYDLVVSGHNRLVLHDILMGEVWLASGQSNMEAYVGSEAGWKGVLHTDQELAEAHFPEIRLFNVHYKIAPRRLTDTEADGWIPVTPQSVKRFSAVAYFFGRELHQRYHVPVGLIDSSMGGTVAEAWMSEGSLAPFPEFRQSNEWLKTIDEQAAPAEQQDYLKKKSEWDRQHGADDRGHDDSGNVWAAPSFNATSWPTVEEPQTKPVEALDGFDGVVWFRKEFAVSAERAGKGATLHLPVVHKQGIMFFNGTKIGDIVAGEEPKDYFVPGNLMRAGRNVVVVRLTGGEGLVGLLGHADRLAVEVDGQTVSLAGQWFYQSGPALSDFPKLPAYSKLISDPNRATVLFNGMIAPLVPYTLKGVIWYQGESNALDHRSVQYRTLFPALIRDWRQAWGYDFPFLFVQLAGWPPVTDEPTESSFALLREAQSMALSLPATAMATAVDQPDSHPRDKQTVAHRLLLTAARVAYGEEILDSGPEFKSMQIEGQQIRIKFSNVGSGLRVHDRYGDARGFAIAGADGRFQWAQARQDGADIVVWNTAISKPTAARYDWMDTPDGDVYSAEGLPLLPFRTDVSKP